MAWTDLAALGAGSKLLGSWLNAVRDNFKAIGDPWTDYTPTITSGAGALGATAINSARYRQAGKTVNLHIDVTITNNGTASGWLAVSLPVAPRQVTVGGSSVGACGGGREIVQTGYGLAVAIQNGALVIVRAADNSYIGATGRRVAADITYEAA